ncbi:uncharacterized protein LOC111643002 [Copidosoma floridanum]|nr:uncharacterized protein LOC111643002 [Copidosoma floridanum]
MKELFKAQLKLQSYICNFYTNTVEKATLESRTVSYYKARLELIASYWAKYTANHDKLIIEEDANAELAYFKDDFYTTCEAEFAIAMGRIRDKITELQPPAPSQDLPAPTSIVQNITNSAPHVALPPIALPTFSGKQGEWESFKQRFCSLVKDKSNISRVEKLQHLLNAVHGQAAHRLKGLDVIDANFDVAWEKLVRRYDNPRIRLFSTLESLLQLSSNKARSAQDLNELIDTTEESVRALRDLNCPVEHYDNWIVHCVVRKLDAGSREAWEASQSNVDGFSTFKALINFLEKRIQTLEQAHSYVDKCESSSKQSSNSTPRKSNKVTVNNAQTVDQSEPKSSPLCDLCKGPHWLHRCSHFNAKSQSQRLDFCKGSKLCLNCLRKGHKASKCPSSNRCFKCQLAHHTKLHSEDNSQNKGSGYRIGNSFADNGSQPTGTSANSDESYSHVASHSASVGASVLLATAKILISNALGKKLTVRALIDPCAERCFISQRVVQQLKLDSEKTSISVIGVGSEKTSTCKTIAHGILQSSTDKSFAMGFSALVLNELTRCLPKDRVVSGNWPHLRGLILADPQFSEPAKVDCILGADIYPILMLEGMRRGPMGTPCAQQSVFGWLLTGAISPINTYNQKPVRVFHLTTEPSLSQQLTQFWEIEEIPRKALLTPDEQRCEQHFVDTHYREQNGRFVVRLPFAKQPKFSGSRDVAAACLRRSEKRLQRDMQLAERYQAFMLEYLELNHMEPVPSHQVLNPGFYLPHHAVVRPENPAKIRVVFNASQKSQNGLSLNDMLLSGPKLQADISIVLSLWRRFRFAFTTDVIKMFRQIKVHQDDADWQRILWRDNTSKPIQDYRCITVTYGTSSAPFLALRVMKQIATDGSLDYPEGASILRHTLYVDDLFGGADTINEAVRRREQLINLLGSAGMVLDKWAANSLDLLAGLNSSSATEVELNQNEVKSTLGIKWLPKDDVFSFTATVTQATCVTKRSILSEVARLFDPLGWLAPMIIVAKVIMQDLWLDHIDWDTPVPDQLHSRWFEFQAGLAEIPRIRIPRWLNTLESDDWQLHGFADASQRAYAAALYVVIPGRQPMLLTAKTKVAPTKVQSLPRLELCGATLLARLISHTLDASQQPPASIHCWSDSRVVLEWLKGHPSKWQTFIANRTSEIITSLPTATWRHVRSADNAADCASRGVSTADLAEHKLW